MKEKDYNQIDGMFLSIIIPVYNCEKYLEDCLLSCLEQDIPKSDYEIICINDGSSDNSEDILSDYSFKYPNIKYFSQMNKGVSSARNYGIEMSQGKYIMFLDADDFLADNCLKKCMSMLCNASSKTMLCYGLYYFTDRGYYNRYLYYKSGEYLGCKPTSGYITNRIIPSYYTSQLRFQENIAYGEDEVFTFELKMMGLDTIILDQPLYYYRKNPNSVCMMTPEKRLKRIDSLIDSALYIREKYDLNQKEVLWFFNHRIKMALDLLVYVKYKDKIHYFKILKNLGLMSPYIKNTRTLNLIGLYIRHSFNVNKKRVKRKIKKVSKKE